MQTLKSQQGMTAIGWIIVLGLIAFFVLLALRLTPGYLEFATVAASLESLEKEPGITEKTAPEIRSMLGKRFDVNDVKTVDSRDVKIENKGGRLRVWVDYEVRVPVLGNIDAVSKFNKEIEVVRH
ncbi:MAG: DUF4845 domain-containing protein [Thiohalobacteraceae bacterium]